MNDITVAETENQNLPLLAKKVELAKSDARALNSLLQEYTPFIKKCVFSVFFSKETKDDNLTEAMLAFAHSVKSYRPENGSFAAYSRAVIRNRLIDLARSDIARENHLVREAKTQNQNYDESSDFYDGVSLSNYNSLEDEKNLALEIDAISAEFKEWGFDWKMLQKKCPKQERSRKICQEAAKAILSSPELFNQMMAKKQLPFQILSLSFPKKALEKYRVYIIALVLISRGEYPYIYSFVPKPLYLEEK